MDNLITKVFETEFGFGHYTVLIYDNKDYELYEMSKPLDRNGVNHILSYGTYDGEIFEAEGYGKGRSLEYFGNEISVDELMDEKNLDIRTAIKNKQENFYELPY